jgi:integrase
MSQQLIPAETAGALAQTDQAMRHAGAAADTAASRSVFRDYRARKAQRTRDAHDGDLARFAIYLADAGVAPGDMIAEPEAWAGVSWGLVTGFVRWQVAEGYAIGSINRALSTVKTYAKLAAKAGTLSSAAYAMIKAVEGYGHTEGKRLDTGRETQRRGHKKAHATSVSPAHAAALKQQPDTPTGRRDALLMCILLDHGLRCGEVAILARDAIDLEAGTLAFYRPKVDITQTHQLTADTLRAAMRYLQNDGAGAIYLLRGSRRGDHLSDDRMGERSINARVQLLGATIGIADLSPHDLRHAWATAAVRGGTDIKSLQDAGGWASPAMPLRYAESAKIANQGVKLG